MNVNNSTLGTSLIQVTVLVENDYKTLEIAFNEFARTVHVIDVKVHEQYVFETDTGVVSYHIFWRRF